MIKLVILLISCGVCFCANNKTYELDIPTGSNGTSCKIYFVSAGDAEYKASVDDRCDLGRVLWRDFQNYQKKYNKKYRSLHVTEERLRNYSVNKIKQLFMQKTDTGTAIYGDTPLSDRKVPEVKLEIPQNVTMRTLKLKVKHRYGVPESFDWRERNIVGPVRKQISCPACWAIAAAVNIESVAALLIKRLIPVSSQQILDCNIIGAGCAAAPATAGFDYAQHNFLVQETEYPYKDSQGMCQAQNLKGIFRIDKYYQVPQDEELMKQYLVTYGPIVTAFNSDLFNNYLGNIISVDHTVCPIKYTHIGNIVGYGVEYTPQGPLPYWTIMNSWGEQWGEKGYFRILRGQHTCGVGMINFQVSIGL